MPGGQAVLEALRCDFLVALEVRCSKFRVCKMVWYDKVDINTVQFHVEVVVSKLAQQPCIVLLLCRFRTAQFGCVLVCVCVSLRVVWLIPRIPRLRGVRLARRTRTNRHSQVARWDGDD